MLSLIYLTANASWVFVFGDTPIKMAGEPMFFERRGEAVEAAERHTLTVDRDGTTRAAE